MAGKSNKKVELSPAEKKQLALENKIKHEKRSKLIEKIIIGLVVVIIVLMGLTIYVYKSNKMNIYVGNTLLKRSSAKKNTTTTLPDVSKVTEEVLKSVVSITSAEIIESGHYGIDYADGSLVTKGAGSGIIIGENNKEIFILTNNHVIEGASTIKVGFNDDKKYVATIKGNNVDNDIAVLVVAKSDLDKDTLKAIKVISTGYSEDLKPGNGVIAIGNALGYGKTVSIGIISALDREIMINNNTVRMLQLDINVNSGNSGGALVNEAGELIGLVTAKYQNSNVEGIGFAIPISKISNLIQRLMNGSTKDDSIDLGIGGYIINSENSADYNMPKGFYISSITKDSIAANYGLEIGNIIVAIDDNEINNINDINNVLNNKKKNDKIKLEIKYASGIEYKEKIINITV